MKRLFVLKLNWIFSFFCLPAFMTLLFSCSSDGEFLSNNNLEYIYNKDSEKLYNQFLKNWYEESTPQASLETLSDLHKDVYQIFMDFYNPFDPNRIGRGEWGSKLYSGIDYVVVQNSIYIYTHNTDNLDFYSQETLDSSKKDSIINFRPSLHFDQAKVLFLTPTYNQIINDFLGSQFSSIGSGGIMNPSQAKGDSEKRLNFLNKKLRIVPGHWGGYWHIETHPEVFNIEFNKDRTMAKINFRLIYEGGNAIYSKENGHWKFQKSQLSWVE